MHATQVVTNPLLELHKYGQRPRKDSYRRGWIHSGDLQRLIRDDGITGVTVNPTIFEHAVSSSTDYDEHIHRLAMENKDTQSVYEALIAQDIRMAADVLRPVYDDSDGTDGFISIELPPSMAYDTEGSIREAHRFHQMINRDNIMIKVPGTMEGVPAVEELTADGINVNITLLFSNDNYEAVARAYIRGLQRRLEYGDPLSSVASVASFFVSRIDVLVDQQLQSLLDAHPDRRDEIEPLFGKAAISNAKLAYRRFKEIFDEDEFKELRDQGARVQKVLWASTGTKNPRYSDVYYVEALIGSDTVDTLPPQTMLAFKDHGHVAMTLEQGVDEAEETMRRLKAVGINFDAVTEKLESDGVKSFQKSVDEMMSCLNAKIDAVKSEVQGRQMVHAGDHHARVDNTLRDLSDTAFSRRLWEKDATLWRQSPDVEKSIKNRLGWLSVVDMMTGCADDMIGFADDVKNAGFTHAVLLGMGGSSLSPEVSRLTFGVKTGYPDLIVLDTSVPGAILDAEDRIDVERTLFIVSSKSGTTVETISGFQYFYDRVKSAKGDNAGENFIAITDPGAPLQSLAHNNNFRRTFLNPPDIGGRYSALSYFGLVPAAIIGADIKQLLHQASAMMEACAPCVSPADNPGIILGAVMGELALAGRDKVTIIASPEIGGFGLWVEQLLAESTGKNGTGLVPVTGELLAAPEHYGSDRLFVYLRLETADNRDMDRKVMALQLAGQPVVQIRLDDKYDLGREYFRWEIAVSTAGALLGINPFDEPDVKESKDNTNRLLDEFKSSGKLRDENLVKEEDGIRLYCAPDYKAALDKIRAASPYVEDDIVSYVSAHMSQFQPGNYFALMAFVEQSPTLDGIFTCMRDQMRDAYRAATTFGYGPRFLHSTGQLYKGGPNSGIFIQLTADDADDAPIPGQPYSFSVLKQAEAMGDAVSLRGKGRPLIRLHVGSDVEAGMNRVLEIVHKALGRERS
jgi:transaldolase / glucose-6-phosphate isomerase